MGESICLVNAHAALFLNVDGSTTLSLLPRPSDCTVYELCKVIDCFPDDFGLILNRQTDSVRIFKIDDATIADFGKRLGIKGTSDYRRNQEFRREVLHTQCDEAELTSTEIFFIHRGSSFHGKNLVRLSLDAIEFVAALAELSSEIANGATEAVDCALGIAETPLEFVALKVDAGAAPTGVVSVCLQPTDRLRGLVATARAGDINRLIVEESRHS